MPRLILNVQPYKVYFAMRCSAIGVALVDQKLYIADVNILFLSDQYR